LRILTLTTLYPNAAAPSHGVFVENRLAAFAARHGAEVRVVAPVPWFPVAGDWAGRYGGFARAPLHENRCGVEVRHPRYAIPPKIGMTYAAHALERCFVKAIRALQHEGFDFDLIDAHYLYPDGVAAVRAARRFGKPVAVTARGTDVNFLPRYRRQREMILECVRNADAVVCVAQALKDELGRLGAPIEKIRVLRNGVDLERFRPLDRNAIRGAMRLAGDVIASVGHLTKRKGHHLAIDALVSLPGATLLVVGDGEERRALQTQAKANGVADRTRFLGAVPHDRLAEFYNAADVLALASSREGWPNVLLEAMACGTPVVAAPVWGSVEVVCAPAAGRLAKSPSAQGMAEALAAQLAEKSSREAVRSYAEQYSWDETSDGLKAAFEEAMERARAASSVVVRPLKRELAAGPPRLVVTVDAEEAFDWSQFRNVRHSVSPPESSIGRFQTLARSFGIKPVYLLTHPLISDPRTAAYYRALRESGAADLGLHLHQWTTPPVGAFEGEYFSFQANLPQAAHAQKLQLLADAFETAFGFRARAHRAGRYGVSAACYPGLATVGIDLDFSPSPAFDASRRGGPDFSGISNAPFVVGAKSRIIVTPVSGASALRGASIFLPQNKAKPGLTGSKRRLPRALTAPQRLTCEGTTLKDLIGLTRRLVADRTAILTFSLHSTTTAAGGNPYARDEAAVAAALQLCQDYFHYFQSGIGGEFVSLDQLAALYATADN